MNLEEAQKIIDEVDSDLDIKHRKYSGITLLNTFVDELDFAAGHDIIYCCDFESVVKKMTETEVTLMARYGFFEEEDSWAFFT